MPNNRKLSAEAAEARRAYRRAWYKANPEKQKEYTARYWQKKAKQAQEAGAGA